MMSHTPGSWFPWQNSAGMWDINTEDRLYAQSLASVNDNEYIEGDAEANANLIAAAPDLLEALELLLEREWQDDDEAETLTAARNKARAVIAKAKGERNES